jgi:hypothetical protein
MFADSAGYPFVLSFPAASARPELSGTAASERFLVKPPYTPIFT